MKKLYEELELEIIRFGAADIITASDAAEITEEEDTPVEEDTTGDDSGEEGSNGPIFYDIQGNVCDPPANATPTTISVGDEGGTTTEVPGLFDGTNYWLQDEYGNYHNIGHP